MSTSLVVRQFVQFARKETRPTAPKRLVDAPLCKIETVGFALCQRCQVVGTHDLVSFSNKITWQICRVCFSVHENKVLTDYVLDGCAIERYSI